MVTNRTKILINDEGCQNFLEEEHRLGKTILSQNWGLSKKIILVTWWYTLHNKS